MRDMRIVFGVDDHHLRRRDLAPQLFPVRIGKEIPVPKRFADIFGVILPKMRFRPFWNDPESSSPRRGNLRSPAEPVAAA
jgi:hypothetical protein